MRFTVTLETVSTPGTVDSERAQGSVPLSPPTASNLGPNETVPVAAASSRHSFTIPANDRVIRVTVTPAD